MDSIPEAYSMLVKAIEDGEAEAGVAEAQRLVASGYSLVQIFKEAIEPCLKSIGDRFARLELYLPEMMQASIVVKAIQEGLRSTLSGGDLPATRARVVIGTAFGDIHDLGKNMVASMLEVNGFEVLNLGVGVEPKEFVRRAREFNADIIAISSLLTTSVPYIEETIKMIRENPADQGRFKLMVGGGPVTATFAQSIGADGYGEDAGDAVNRALGLAAAK